MDGRCKSCVAHNGAKLKIILIVTDKYDTLFFHESENIKKVMLKESDIINDDDIDKLYKNKYLNSIPVENFTEAYRSLS